MRFVTGELAGRDRRLGQAGGSIACAALLLCAALACTPGRIFHCGTEDDRCGAGGRCLEGACAFPDDGCGNGLRWIDESADPALAGQCVTGVMVPDAHPDAAYINSGRDGGSGSSYPDAWFGTSNGDGSTPACGSLTGYEVVGTSCYRALGSFVTWADAQADCADDGPGTHLLVIDDANEQLAVEEYTAGLNAWMGLSDRRAEGDFRWVTPTPVGFSHWSGGQPDSALGEEDCGGIDLFGYWHDVDCDLPAAAVCERDGIDPDPSRY